MLPGGGSFFADDLTTSIERHQGDSDGQFIILMEEDEDEDTYYYAYTGSEETFDITEDADYELIAVGGRGGSCNNNSGGYGAQARGIFRLSKGDRLNIVVGGKGGDCNVEVVDFFDASSETMFTGAGGGGGSSIALEEGTSKTRKLLLVGGGGGGAGKDHGGDDGEDGQDGGFPWGGKNKEGGKLSCQDNGSICNFFLIGGAGGGGYDGDGASRCGTFPSCPGRAEDFNPIHPIALNEREECKKENLLAEGGESFQEGGVGGKKRVDASKTDLRCSYRYLNGGFGGFGGGGEGGIFVGGQYLKARSDGYTSHTEKYEHGGGGGGGGYGGGGAGEFQGLGGGG